MTNPLKIGNMTSTTLHRLLTEATKVDMMFNTNVKTSDGWKLSLQGNSVEDACELYELLSSYLIENNIPFKVGTSKRINHPNRQQARKVMTIYVPNNSNVMELAEMVYSLTMNYKGWQDINTPESYNHYAGCVFYRNDRINGEYIPAN